MKFVVTELLSWVRRAESKQAANWCITHFSQACCRENWKSGKRECPSCKHLRDETEKKAIIKIYGTEYDIDCNGFSNFVKMISGEYNKDSDYYNFPEGKNNRFISKTM
jgi:hypothetical protein